MPVESPDLNSYLCLQQEALGQIAAAIGLDEDARMWQERTKDLENRILEHLWDEQAGLFWARRDGAALPVRTPFSLFPLLTGRLPEAVAEAGAHLTNPTSFGVSGSAWR
jgi:neutral trehalase